MALSGVIGLACAVALGWTGLAISGPVAVALGLWSAA